MECHGAGGQWHTYKTCVKTLSVKHMREPQTLKRNGLYLDVLSGNLCKKYIKLKTHVKPKKRKRNGLALDPLSGILPKDKR